jgi:predicted nucleotidyltransferase component of viral defense system
MQERYKKQVALILSVLPEVANEKCFVLHGGTAINLFIRDMPRLSVDIDLTYLPVCDYETALIEIHRGLNRISLAIKKVVGSVFISDRGKPSKLFIQSGGAIVKVEVSLMSRGALEPPSKIALCNRAQEEFDAFVEMQIMNEGQLFGSKICAGLDRQHPRDFFDIRYILNSNGFTSSIKTGFIYHLVSHERPLHELLSPIWKDQRSAFANQFSGMSQESFSYQEYEETRITLLKIIHQNIDSRDIEFLMSLQNTEPDWTIYNFKDFPGVNWKLKNLQRLKQEQSRKHADITLKMKQCFDMFK